MPSSRHFGVAASRGAIIRQVTCAANTEHRTCTRFDQVEDLTHAPTSTSDGDFEELAATRRGLVLAPLLAASPAALLAYPAHAIDPAQTQVLLPDQYRWKPALPSAPAKSVGRFLCSARPTSPDRTLCWSSGIPGFMSAPHTYSPIGCALSSPAYGG